MPCSFSLCPPPQLPSLHTAASYAQMFPQLHPSTVPSAQTTRSLNYKAGFNLIQVTTGSPCVFCIITGVHFLTGYITLVTNLIFVRAGYVPNKRSTCMKSSPTNQWVFQKKASPLMQNSPDLFVLTVWRPKVFPVASHVSCVSDDL